MNPTVTIDALQNGIILFLLINYIVLRKAVITLEKMHTNESHIHILIHEPEKLQCPHCGKVANLHYRGKECTGCDSCYKTH